MEKGSEQKESQPKKQDPQKNNEHYYNEYRQLYQNSLILAENVRETAQRQSDLFQKIDQLNKKAEGFKDFAGVLKEQPKKKTRRTNDQIQRGFKCTVQKCNNTYGSQCALRIHLKLKHEELYKPKKKGRKSQKQLSLEKQKGS